MLPTLTVVINIFVMEKQKVRYLISLMGYLLVRLMKYPYPGDIKIYQLAQLQQSDKQVLCKFPFTN